MWTRGVGLGTVGTETVTQLVILGVVVGLVAAEVRPAFGRVAGLSDQMDDAMHRPGPPARTLGLPEPHPASTVGGLLKAADHRHQQGRWW